MSLNIINNTKAVADGFVNDQLKWRRERIEELTKTLKKKDSQLEDLRKLYSNECKFVAIMRDCLNDVINSTDTKDSKEHKRLIELVDKHIENNNNFLNRNNEFSS